MGNVHSVQRRGAVCCRSVQRLCRAAPYGATCHLAAPPLPAPLPAQDGGDAAERAGTRRRRPGSCQLAERAAEEEQEAGGEGAWLRQALRLLEARRLAAWQHGQRSGRARTCFAGSARPARLRRRDTTPLPLPLLPCQLLTADQVEFWHHPEKAGWMHSQGEHIKTWRKRWFVLKQVRPAQPRPPCLPAAAAHACGGARRPHGAATSRLALHRTRSTTRTPRRAAPLTAAPTRLPPLSPHPSSAVALPRASSFALPPTT
mgnify:CR=1 FL=1